MLRLSSAPTGIAKTSERREHRWPLRLVGGLVAVVVGTLLYTRFSIDSTFFRDEGIYVYGGQQMLHGVAPYASIFDAKTPLATMLSALGAALAKLFAVNDLYTIRVVFLVCSILTVLAIYLLVVELWGSVLAGVVAAVVFASFQGYAADALGGPDAKTPGVLFAVLMMWLAVRRQWFWAGFAGGLTFLVWQPFFPLPLMTVIAAVLASPGRRWRALAVSAGGVLAPVVATIVYFVSVGQFGKFIESTVQFPVEGLNRGNVTLPQRLRRIAAVIFDYYHFSGLLIVIGLLLLVGVAVKVLRRDGWRVALRDPFILVVVLSMVGEVVYAMNDFQWYPDVFPILPYAAIGFGGFIALAMQELRAPEARRRAVAVTLVASAALTGLSALWFTRARANNQELLHERAAACALTRLLVPGRPLYAMGDPVPLVLSHRRNPDRFIYLLSGVAGWKVAHTPGGFSGWTAQIHAAHPSVVVINSWHNQMERHMNAWLRTAGYKRRYVADWTVFLTAGARARERLAGVAPTRRPTAWPQSPAGQSLHAPACVEP